MGIRFAQKGTSIRLRNDRNTAIPGLICGQSVEAAAKILPILLSLCPNAQSAGLLAAAQTIRTQTPIDTVDVRVALEAELETLRFFSMDLRTALCSGSGNRELLGALGTLRGKLLTDRDTPVPDELPRAVRDIVVRWFDSDASVIDDALDRFQKLPAIDLPGRILLAAEELGAPDNAQAIFTALAKADTFALTPTLTGHRLVGALAERQPRQTSWRIEDVLTSRLEEIRALRDGLPTRFGRIRTQLLGTESAFALTQTARGPLVSVITLYPDTHIRSYATIAPTEWAFQPQGIADTLLGTLLRKSPLLPEEDLKLVATVLDPCTDIEFRNTGHA